MPATGKSSASLGLHSMPMAASRSSFTLLTRYVPASTGVQGSRLTSQRGVTPIHCGGVLVVLASWRAPPAPNVKCAPLVSVMLQISDSDDWFGTSVGWNKPHTKQRRNATTLGSHAQRLDPPPRVAIVRDSREASSASSRGRNDL